MPRLTTQRGTPLHINPDHVVAIEPATDAKTQTPVLGECVLLMQLPPPNVPGAGHTSIVVKGSFEEVCRTLFPEDYPCDESAS